MGAGTMWSRTSSTSSPPTVGGVRADAARRLSYEEAADVVGCPIGTIRSRVATARADLLVAVDRAAAR